MRINVPPCTRILLVLLVGFSLVYQAASYRAHTLGNSTSNVIPWITLTPRYSVYYPWVYITSTLAEQNIITLLIAGATVFFGGRYLERAWGSQEFIKFILIASLVPNVAVAILYALAFAVSRADTIAHISIQGSISLQAGFLVAFKQLVPEHTVTILKGIIKIRVKHFPAIFLIANTISGVIFFTDTAAALSWLGFLSSWTYLRFYKQQPDLSGTSTGGSTLKGDASETFAFAYFWPDIVHAPVAAISDLVFNFLVLLRICTPFTDEEVETSNQQAGGRGQELPNIMGPDARHGASKREEAERRRKLALKALDQRLQAASASRQTPLSSPALQSSRPEPSTPGNESTPMTGDGESKT
ncbi:MAG: hypothetical protein LQ340_002988 [Diploschistes diacapsis]|nr:MAG: hypothetical protein LQ340_002988 [Diploschistes diacapsis]